MNLFLKINGGSEKNRFFFFFVFRQRYISRRRVGDKSDDAMCTAVQ